MAITSGERIATLDILRGVAVMGILAMNIVSFADVPAAYLNPLAQTAVVRTGDLIAYAVNFVAIDGKMRGLFSFLFGASVLLIAERMSAAKVGRRLFWLLAFGALHFYFIWWGDILIAYALIGFLALAFRNASPRALMITAVLLIAVQLAIFTAITAWSLSLQEAMANKPGAETVRSWTQMSRDMAVPTAEHRTSVMALYLGPWSGIVEHQLTDKTFFPLVGVFVFGWETLGCMLLGMAALKTGLLTGAWEDRRYRKWALVCLCVALPVYLVALRFLFRSDWAVPSIFMWGFAATVPVRPLMVVAYACLIILLTRRGGWLVERIAAAGRAAFSNYLGTSIVMTGLFYGWGLGLFGKLGRIELAGVLIVACAIMLAWSKPWLERYRYGPLEWLWRSLTNMRVEQLRRPAVEPAATGATA
jgi:uncharacterized protein